MIEVWGRQSSINVQKVMWLADELAIPLVRYDAGGAYGVVNTDEFVRLNPNRLIPVLRDDGLVLWESHTILRYLAAKSGNETFWPGDPAKRALLERWLDWAGATLGPSMSVLLHGLIRTRAENRDNAAIAKAQASAAQRFRVLDEELRGKRFIGGDELTIADIAPGAAAYRWLNIPIDRPHTPNLQAWYNRLTERASFKVHVMIPII